MKKKKILKNNEIEKNELLRIIAYSNEKYLYFPNFL